MPEQCTHRSAASKLGRNSFALPSAWHDSGGTPEHVIDLTVHTRESCAARSRRGSYSKKLFVISSFVRRLFPALARSISDLGIGPLRPLLERSTLSSPLSAVQSKSANDVSTVNETQHNVAAQLQGKALCFGAVCNGQRGAVGISLPRLGARRSPNPALARCCPDPGP